MREPVRFLTRARVASDLGDPERGPAAQHGRGRGGLSARAGADGARAARVREGVRRADRRRLLRHDARASRRDCRSGAARGGNGERRSRRSGRRARTARTVPRVSSAMRAITLHQEPAPLLVGERVNSQGSRKVKRLLLADDYEGILDVAREQVDSGAHVLDVCVALTERGDEAEQMSKLVKLLSMSVETPLMIDSTEASVIEAALEHVPGRAIINSINMENGRKRIDAVVPLAKKHGAALVALTIDEVGMAKTRERKLEVARDDLRHRRRRVRARRRGPHLRRAHVHARDGRRGVDRQREGDDRGHPAHQARAAGRLHDPRRVERELRARRRRRAHVLNSVFLHHCVQAGLDAAIVNPAHITPYVEISDERARAGGRSRVQPAPDALQRFIEALRGTAGREVGTRGRRRIRRQGMTPEAAGPLDGPAPEEGRHRGRRSTRPACARIRCAC